MASQNLPHLQILSPKTIYVTARIWPDQCMSARAARQLRKTTAAQLAAMGYPVPVALRQTGGSR